MSSSSSVSIQENKALPAQIPPKEVPAHRQPIQIAFVIIFGLGGLITMGIGIAGLAGGISTLGQANSIIMIAFGFLVTSLVGLCFAYLVKQREDAEDKKGKPITDIYDEMPPEGFSKMYSFGFKLLKGFHLKEDVAYILADNPDYMAGTRVRVAKAEIDSILRRHQDGTELSAQEKKSLSTLIPDAAKEYKIHLMPKSKHMETVITRLLAGLGGDGEIKQHVAQYKVLKGEVNEEDGAVVVPLSQDKEGGYFPRIVIYTESKEAGQAILDTVLKLFPDAEELGDEILPRGNTKVNKLIYYANGSGGMKNRAEKCGVELQEGPPEEYQLKINLDL
jgi:hypothetical protein